MKLEGVLGKGGFGVVHLGTLGTQKVAVKQLLQVNIHNLKLFRFECFLMKNLRHPNIVKLVGVCWDDLMLGLCLEYVSDEAELLERIRVLEGERTERGDSNHKRYSPETVRQEGEEVVGKFAKLIVFE